MFSKCLMIMIFSIGFASASDKLAIHKVHMELGGADKAKIPSIIVYSRENQEFLSKQQVAKFLKLSKQEIESVVFSKYIIELPKRNVTIKSISDFVPDIYSCITYCIFYIRVPSGDNMIRNSLLRLDEVESTISSILSRNNNIKLFEM